jgi:hypothetical protein
MQTSASYFLTREAYLSISLRFLELDEKILNEKHLAQGQPRLIFQGGELLSFSGRLLAEVTHL